MWRKIISKFKGIVEEVEELKEAIGDEKYIEKKLNTVSEAEMLRLDREELRRRARAFSKSDWEIVISEAPIEMIHNRIGSELVEAKAFKKRVSEAFESVGVSGLLEDAT